MGNEQWTPVADGHYCNGRIEVENIWLWVTSEKSGIQIATKLPDKIRLCGRVPYDPQPDDDESNMDRYCRGFNDGVEFARRQVDRPRPDWNYAPDGANWWAVDPDGYCHWFENEPILEQVTSAPDIIGPRWSHHGSKWIRYEAVNIPIGIDWRELCERRPEANADE